MNGKSAPEANSRQTEFNWTAGRTMRLCLLLLLTPLQGATADDARIYQNKLVPLKNAEPLLADYPEFVEPVMEVGRFEAPRLVNDDDADLSVRAWRFSYNARGIIEMPNRLNSRHTAVIMVHPWGIDDAQGWRTPEPAGAADFCTPEKNHLAGRHTREVIDPFLKRMRPKVPFIMYSLIGSVDPIRKKLYRTLDSNPTAEERATARKRLAEKLNTFDYTSKPLPAEFRLSQQTPVIDYFRSFPGLTAHNDFNGAGFWQLPVPIHSDVTAEPDDVLIFDVEGYDPLKTFLQQHGIRHILLTGLQNDRGLRKSVERLQRLSCWRRHPGDVSGQLYTTLCHQRSHIVRIH